MNKLFEIQTTNVGRKTLCRKLVIRVNALQLVNIWILLYFCLRTIPHQVYGKYHGIEYENLFIFFDTKLTKFASLLDKVLQKFETFFFISYFIRFIKLFSNSISYNSTHLAFFWNSHGPFLFGVLIRTVRN